MNLATFNTLPCTEALAVIAPCLHVTRWATEIVAARPFADREALFAFAASAAPDWTDAELQSALSRHPRIGERPRDASPEAAHSRAEQAAVDHADANAAASLAAGNRAYEEKFGHVFLISAMGRSTDEILAALDVRLKHDPATEKPIVMQQLREIALLRLGGIFPRDTEPEST